MLSILGTIGLMLLIIILGKYYKEIRWTSFLFLIFITLIQVIIVLYVMYITQPPEFKL